MQSLTAALTACSLGQVQELNTCLDHASKWIPRWAVAEHESAFLIVTVRNNRQCALDIVLAANRARQFSLQQSLRFLTGYLWAVLALPGGLGGLNPPSYRFDLPSFLFDPPDSRKKETENRLGGLRLSFQSPKINKKVSTPSNKSLNPPWISYNLICTPPRSWDRFGPIGPQFMEKLTPPVHFT